MKKIFTLLFLFCFFYSFSQKKNEAFQYHIKRAASPIVIDGIMDEEAWQQAQTATDFFMVLPMDTSKAQVRTDVKMTYDNQNLYLIAICYNALPGPYMVESLRRDFNFGKNDNFLLFMDPFDDQTNGFSFGANAAGAQWDGIMYEGGAVDLSWDNKWYSAVKNYPDKYIFEAAIPFKTIRYKKGITRWGINFSRNDLKTTEKSSWAPVPRQFPTASLAYTGTLVWDQPPPEAGLNVSVIPYALVGSEKDFITHNKTIYHKDVGVDAKIALTSSLNLDLTVHPDFSQVEVDKQVTNLSRYELFFPERRQFFLENADLFANFGYDNIRPFFSRRIGLGVPIEYGARLSGKLNKNWRIGAMFMRTGKVDDLDLPDQSFSVVALQRRVFSRSNIRFLFIDKESLNYHPNPDSVKYTYSAYNRNIGFEYNLASSNNMWTGKALFLKSFSPGKSSKDFVHAANLQYSSKYWLLLWRHEFVGNNYMAEAGYVPRRNYIKLNPQITRYFFPKGGAVLSHGPQFNSINYFDEHFNQTDNQNILSYLVTFRTKATLTALVSHDYVRLLQPFDPTNLGKDSLLVGTKHHWNTAGFDFVSQPQKLFTYTLSARAGGYYANGSYRNFATELGYRFQPYVSVALSGSYNNINLPQPWGNTTFWLIGPRLDVTFTNKLYFTTFIQYNEQLKNVNLNTRLQWRYKPASDFYLVYTDNYYPAPFSVRNRAFVLKFNYWWNL
ncbi:MAG: DUF5916 domain-containing protein [Ilyomonas sp.]